MRFRVYDRFKDSNIIDFYGSGCGKELEYKIDDNNTYIVGKYGPVIKTIEGTDKNGKDVVIFNKVIWEVVNPIYLSNHFKFHMLVFLTILQEIWKRHPL